MIKLILFIVGLIATAIFVKVVKKDLSTVKNKKNGK